MVDERNLFCVADEGQLRLCIERFPFTGLDVGRQLLREIQKHIFIKIMLAICCLFFRICSRNALDAKCRKWLGDG